jgi:hypothetical protein
MDSSLPFNQQSQCDAVGSWWSPKTEVHLLPEARPTTFASSGLQKHGPGTYAYAELDGTNQLIARYLHGDEFGQPFARVTYEPTSPEVGSTPQVHWRLTDHLNSVRLVLPPSRRPATAEPPPLSRRRESAVPDPARPAPPDDWRRRLALHPPLPLTGVSGSLGAVAAGSGCPVTIRQRTLLAHQVTGMSLSQNWLTHQRICWTWQSQHSTIDSVNLD